MHVQVRIEDNEQCRIESVWGLGYLDASIQDIQTDENQKEFVCLTFIGLLNVI